MCAEENEAAMKHLIDFCKKYGAKHRLQLCHAGHKRSTQPQMFPCRQESVT